MRDIAFTSGDVETEEVALPVPLPSDTKADLSAPSAHEAEAVLRGVVGAIAGPAGLTSLQCTLLAALFHSMTGHDLDPAVVGTASAEELASTLALRNRPYRTRILQIILLGALILTPLPKDTSDRVRGYATELDIDAGALDVAAADFARNGYLASLDPARLTALHVQALEQPWGAVITDTDLAARWTSLEQLPVGTLGRGVADFYADRGFIYPGKPDSAPPLLAQHDWVHVLAGYGTTLENELEVFAFIARANDDTRAFSLLAMVVSLFETGYLAAGAGLFEADPGHLRLAGVPERLGDAMRRGALLEGSHDFLALDWFSIAEQPLAALRDDLGVRPKQVATPGPWDAGGITPYQLNSARRLSPARAPWRPDPSRS
jgi:hypothetical protein